MAQPDTDIAEARIRQSRPMRRETLGYQDILDRRSFAGDFRIAIGVAFFLFVMQIDEQVLDRVVLVLDFLDRKSVV